MQTVCDHASILSLKTKAVLMHHLHIYHIANMIPIVH